MSFGIKASNIDFVQILQRTDLETETPEPVCGPAAMLSARIGMAWSHWQTPPSLPSVSFLTSKLLLASTKSGSLVFAQTATKRELTSFLRQQLMPSLGGLHLEEPSCTEGAGQR